MGPGQWRVHGSDGGELTELHKKPSPISRGTLGQSLPFAHHAFPVAMQGHTMAVKSIAFSPDGRQLVTGSDDGTMRIWDLASGQHVATLEVGDGPPLYLPV